MLTARQRWLARSCRGPLGWRGTWTLRQSNVRWAGPALMCAGLDEDQADSCISAGGLVRSPVGLYAPGMRPDQFSGDSTAIPSLRWPSPKRGRGHKSNCPVLPSAQGVPYPTVLFLVVLAIAIAILSRL